MEYGVALGVLCIAVGGVAAQWVAWRLRLPAIVLLFSAGLLAGPAFGVLTPSKTVGPMLQPIVGLAVAIIVFEGGLALNLRDLRAAGEGVLRLTAVALPISAVLGTLAAHVIAGMGWGPAALFGAITVVTGPTVVLPLLRHTKLEPRAAAFLKWEAIVNDPVGAILAAVVLEVLLANGSRGGVPLHLVLGIVAGLLAATALGIGAAQLVRWAFLRDQVPEVLKTPILLALALGVYAVANLVVAEAGLMAATLFGVALTNLRVPGLAELRRFKEALVVMLVSALFIVLTADLDRGVLARLSLPIVGLTAAMLLGVRPLAIVLATLRSGLTSAERTLAGWIAPRGIVAAAVAGVAGLRLQSAGYAGADQVMPAVFALIAATMILHGFTLGPLSRRLNLQLGGVPGLAIVGTSAWTIDLASVLVDAGVPTLLIDLYPGALAPARRKGLAVLQTEILSEHGEEGLAAQAVDYLIAATPNTIYNGLVCARFAPELGRERVFQLAPDGLNIHHRLGVSRDWRGKILGRPAWDHDLFESRYDAGWRFHAVTVPRGSEDGEADDTGASAEVAAGAAREAGGAEAAREAGGAGAAREGGASKTARESDPGDAGTAGKTDADGADAEAAREIVAAGTAPDSVAPGAEGAIVHESATAARVATEPAWVLVIRSSGALVFPSVEDRVPVSVSPGDTVVAMMVPAEDTELMPRTASEAA